MLGRRHYLECPQGLLGKHFEKLIQCDPRLNFLSQQPEIILDSPHFESRISVFEDPSVSDSEFNLNSERSPTFLNLHGAASPSGAHCSSSNGEQDFVAGRRLENIRPETPSPSSGKLYINARLVKTQLFEKLDSSAWCILFISSLFFLILCCLVEKTLWWL